MYVPNRPGPVARDLGACVIVATGQIDFLRSTACKQAVPTHLTECALYGPLKTVGKAVPNDRSYGKYCSAPLSNVRGEPLGIGRNIV
jgi:hypothetical protein